MRHSVRGGWVHLFLKARFGTHHKLLEQKTVPVPAQAKMYLLLSAWCWPANFVPRLTKSLSSGGFESSVSVWVLSVLTRGRASSPEAEDLLIICLVFVFESLLSENHYSITGTRNKDATNGAPGLTTRNKKLRTEQRRASRLQRNKTGRDSREATE